MSFEAYMPPHAASLRGLPPGQCSIDRKGTLAVASVDLATVGIRDACVLLIDRNNIRAALRAPFDDDFEIQHVPLRGKPKSKTKRSAKFSGVLKTLSIDPLACDGRHELEVKTSGGPPMLIINLADAAAKQKAKKK